jgi:hypothetical protein
MATYYVRNDGSNANTGTGPATNQAWQTIAYAFANMTLTTGTNYLYIAPGVYRESVSLGVTPTATNTLVIAGDPTASQFSGITPNQVRLTGAANDSSTSPTGTRIDTNAKSYITIQDIVIEGATSQTVSTFIVSGTNTTINRVVVYAVYYAGTPSQSLAIETPNTTNNQITIQNSTFIGGSIGIRIRTPVATSGVSGVIVQNCRIITGHNNSTGIYLQPQSGTTMSSVLITNCFVIASTCVNTERGNTTDTHFVQNCILAAGSTGISSGSTSVIVQRNNIINCSNTLSNVSTTANTISADFLGVDLTQNLLQGFGHIAPFGTLLNSRNTGFGIATNAPVTDSYGVAWTGATPDVGAVTYRSLSAVGLYNPTERNASTITIAPGSTSQSIELYLGATGLTASSSGLSARYNRTRTASVSIPLVARTIAQAWTSGGFAEVDSTNMPGVYRIDIPDAALAAGADDVTVVVRGASGTNGAVMTVKLSSGGLTEAQTAGAVWNSATTSYTANGSFGLNVLRADQQNKAGNVTLHSSGNVNRVDADVHAIANDADAATELKGALLHNGTDYISAELLSPVSAATSVHIGPYQLLADGLGADQPLDVNVGTATSIDVQVTDANGTGIDITGATVSAKVYNSGGTLVATYAGTATYADNGRLTFGLTTTVTNTSGTYTVTVTRTTGATDTQIFGPLRLYVRPV